jgi:hypothetical protein
MPGPPAALDGRSDRPEAVRASVRSLHYGCQIQPSAWSLATAPFDRLRPRRTGGRRPKSLSNPSTGILQSALGGQSCPSLPPITRTRSPVQKACAPSRGPRGDAGRATHPRTSCSATAGFSTASGAGLSPQPITSETRTAQRTARRCSLAIGDSDARAHAAVAPIGKAVGQRVVAIGEASAQNAVQIAGSAGEQLPAFAVDRRASTACGVGAA